MSDREKTREELLAELAELRRIINSYKSGEKLRESEATARALLNAPHDSALLVEPNGTIVTANQWAADHFGCTVEELEGRNVFQFFPAEVVERRKPFGEEARKTGKPVRQVDQRDGRWYDYTVYPIHDAGGEQVVRFAIFARDITVQKEMESALQESEQKYRNLVEQSQQGIVVFMEGRLAFVNSAAAAIHQRSVEELTGMSAGKVQDTIYAEDREPMFRWITGIFQGEEEPTTNEYRFVRKDGVVRWCRITASVIEFGGQPAVQGIVLDIDDSKKLGQRIAQAAKLEAVGRLAGGVAHDFNNLLTAILGYGRSLLKKLGPESPLRESAEEISYAADRAAALTKQLLAFSRVQTLRPELFDINLVIQRMEYMLTNLIGSKIRVEIRTMNGLGKVKADPGQLEQVLMNLALNARDAMEEGGLLTIETSRVEMDAQALRENPDAVPGTYVRLAVRDTGVGLDDKQQRHIFEPFFSTKGLTEGTGLGLSVVYGIVRQHGGVISVESEVGRGSCFCVCLPLDNGASAADEEESQPIPPAVKQGNRVLVVEDERVVRQFINGILREYGYEVAVAKSAEEAEERFGHEIGSYNLLLADIMLPGRSGISLVKDLTANHPDLAVVLTSGYEVKESELNMVRVSNHHYLQKPFTEEELIASVRLALEQISPDSSRE